jgi:hypothetical protein
MSTTSVFASFINQVGGGGMVTLNYGTASPQEGAAWLAWFNAPVSSNVTIGNGPQWSDATSAWVTKNWQTSGYWASLRAANPLAVDDGLNHLRIGRAAPFGLHFFEVGNEIYGNWEVDHHAVPWDPATYIQFAKDFAGLANQIDPSITIGVDGSGTGGNYGSAGGGNWTSKILDQCVIQNFTPGYVSDHNYMFDPGNENDDNLLRHSATDPAAVGYGGPINFAGRATAYRNLINSKLGALGPAVKLLCTEFNSVSYNPSQQTTSLVNGLWLADALGGIMKTEYESAIFWDLRNAYDTSHFHVGLYGWRLGGDYGMLGDANGPAPATGTYIAYPTYFAEQLVSKLAHQDDSVVSANSDTTFLSVYATRQANGHLTLMVINKSPNTDFTAPVQIQGFIPAAQATLNRYGKTQDTAQQNSSDGASSLEQLSPNLTVTPITGGASFSFAFPQYSMTVLDLAPAPPTVQSVQIDDGTLQRSRIRSLKVTFDATVDLGAGAFELTRQGGGAPAMTVMSTIVGGHTVATLTFSGPGSLGTSLIDGQYSFRVVAGQVTVGGTPMAADSITNFHRFFGDFDGNATVNSTDFAGFRNYFGLGDSIFDFDGDGQTNSNDFSEFRKRFGTTLVP